MADSVVDEAVRRARQRGLAGTMSPAGSDDPLVSEAVRRARSATVAESPTNAGDPIVSEAVRRAKSVSVWHGLATPPAPAPQPQPGQDDSWLGAISRFGRGLFHPEPKTPEDWEAQNERGRRVFMGTPEKPTIFTPETPERPTTPYGYVRQAYQQGGALGAAGEVAKMAVTGPLYGAIKQRDTPLVQLGEAFDPGTEARGVGEAVSHFTTPTNATIVAGASLLTGIPAAALSAYFATDMGIGAYQAAQEIAKAKAEGREGDARELTGQLMVMIPAAVGAGAHAGKKTVGIIGDRAGRIKGGEPTTQPSEITSVDAPAVGPSPLIDLPAAKQRARDFAGSEATGGAPPQGPAVPPPPGAGGPPESTPASNWLLSEPESWVKTRTRGEDMNYAVKSLEKMIPGGREALPVDQSPWALMKSYAGLTDKVMDTMRQLKKELKPVRNTVRQEVARFMGRETGPQLADITAKYTENQHLLDLMEHRPEYVAPGNRTRADVIAEQRAIQESLSPEQLARVRQGQQAIVNHSKKLLDESERVGSVTPEAAAEMRRLYPNYKPMERYFEELQKELDNPYAAGKSFSTASNNAIKRLKEGSEAETIELGQSLLSKTFKTYAKNEQVGVGNALYNLKDYLPDLVVPAREGMPAPPGMAQVHTLVKGKDQPFYVPEPVAEAVQGYTKRNADLLSKLAGKSTNYLRMGAVGLNLAYAPIAAGRDIYNAFMRSPVGVQPWTLANGWAHAFADAFGYRSQHMSEYFQNKAGMAGFTEQAKSPKLAHELLFESEAKRIGKQVLNPLHMIHAIGQAIELGPRVGVAIRAKNTPTVTPFEAHHWARDVTVDFNQAGALTRLVNLWTPFLSARVGGQMNLARAFRDNPGEALLLWGAMFGVPAIVTYLYNTRNHPDVDRDLPDYFKKSNQYMILSNRKDEDGRYGDVLTFPKNEYAQLDGPLLEVMKQMDQENPNILNKLAWEMGVAPKPKALAEGQSTPPEGMLPVVGETVANMLPIDITPQGRFDPVAGAALAGPPAIRGALENTINRRFWNLQDIESREMVEREPWRRFDMGRDPDFVQWLGRVQKDFPEWAQVGPRKIQNFIETQFGGVGQQIVRSETPLAQAKRRLFGAPSGAMEDRKIESFAPANKAYAMETADLVEPARKFVREMDKLKDKPEEARRYVQENWEQLSPDIRGEVKAILKRKRGELTDAEQKLRTQSPGPRAVNLQLLLNNLYDETPEQARARWAKGGLLTPDTLRMMRQIQAAEAQGVEPKLRRPRR